MLEYQLSQISPSPDARPESGVGKVTRKRPGDWLNMNSRLGYSDSSSLYRPPSRGTATRGTFRCKPYDSRFAAWGSSSRTAKKYKVIGSPRRPFSRSEGIRVFLGDKPQLGTRFRAWIHRSTRRVSGKVCRPSVLGVAWLS